MMQTINDYDKDVFNGDLGFVQAVDPEAQELVLNFDGRLVNSCLSGCFSKPLAVV